MRNSFVDQLKSQKAPEEAPVETTQTAVAEADQENPQNTEDPNDEVESSAQEQEDQDQPTEISEELRDKLMNKNSLTKKLEEARKRREAEQKAQEEAEQEQEEEDAEEDQEEEDEEQEEVTFQVGDQTFKTLDEVNAHLKEFEAKQKELEEEKAEIQGFVEKVSDPELVEVLSYVAQGHSFRTAMVKAGLDESIFQVEADDVDAEALVEAKLERKKQLKENEKRQKELQTNMEQSNTVLSEFQKEKGFDDKVKENLVNAMADFQSKAMKGLITKDSLELFLKAINYEQAVQKAEQKGEIKGRNEKITIERKKKEGDRIPSLGRGLDATSPAPQKNNLSDLVRQPASSFTQLLSKNRNQ